MLEATTRSATILLLQLLDKVINTLDHRTTRKAPDDIILMEIRLLQKRISDLRARLHPPMAAHEPHYDGPPTQTRSDIRLVELAHLERIQLAELAYLERLWLAELAHLEKVRLAEMAHQERMAELALLERTQIFEPAP